MVIGGCESVAATALDFVGMLFYESCQQQTERQGKGKGRCTGINQVHFSLMQVHLPRDILKLQTEQPRQVKDI